jgi:hypothetical protein
MFQLAVRGAEGLSSAYYCGGSGSNSKHPLSERFMENEVALRDDFLPALVLSPLSIIRSMLHAHI